MGDYSVASGSLELCVTLRLIVVLPLIAAAYAAWLALSGRDARGGNATRTAASLGVGTSLAALAGLAGHAAWLATLPRERRLLVDPVFELVRIGSLDVSLGLSLDALDAWLGIAIAGAGSAALFQLARARADRSVELGQLAAANLVLGGALISTLADGFVTLALGWGILGVASSLLFARIRAAEQPRAAFALFMAARASEIAVLAAAVVVFWNFGGSFQASEFMPDFRARLIAADPPVAAGSAATESKGPSAGPGFLTMSVLREATLTVGGADLCAIDDAGKPGGLGTSARPCRWIARSPFVRLPIPAVVHDVRVSAGPGTNELSVEKVRISSGVETRLVLLGPSLGFRELATQLGVRERSGDYLVRRDIASRKLWGLPPFELAAVLLLLAVALRAALAPFHRWLDAAARLPASESILVVSVGLSAGAVLLVKCGFVLTMAPVASGLATLLGGVGACWVASRAVYARDSRRAGFFVVVSQLGIVLVGAAVGTHAASALYLGILVMGGAALLLATHARAHAVALVVLCGAPVPALGIFWAREAVLWGSFTEDNVAYVPGWLGCVLVGLASATIAYAGWRSYFLAFTGKSRQRSSPPAEPTEIAGVARAVGAVALFAGLLGVSPSGLGLGSERSVIEAFLPPSTTFGEPRFVPVGSALRGFLLAVGFAIPLAAWWAARARYGAGRSASWREEESRAPLFALLTAGDDQATALPDADAGVDARSEAQVAIEPSERAGESRAESKKNKKNKNKKRR